MISSVLTSLKIELTLLLSDYGGLWKRCSHSYLDTSNSILVLYSGKLVKFVAFKVILNKYMIYETKN